MVLQQGSPSPPRLHGKLLGTHNSEAAAMELKLTHTSWRKSPSKGHEVHMHVLTNVQLEPGVPS